MTTSALVMMVVYLGLVGGGLGFGVALMATHNDETSGVLGTADVNPADLS
ncbi:methionine/alanine import family NSS transporter small subunit [Arcanobacterium phocisimile]|uniref:Methionine/alanine import family NSS transporter small subunit n=1 Tax=Arcanobacterium phocisimile TaxID=1302235 RepID=A0ABX7IFL2_9ACTO|nr:methionine/alanine import family NSS transporter small subunit [Arcanobacterium phocisimile]QRV01926.1 methionine/alanine import family NSS transporter small subunit [Arcanobacterium phocisimile]